jgi:hypothetical protein
MREGSEKVRWKGRLYSGKDKVKSQAKEEPEV